VTLIQAYELYLDILKLYLYTETKLLGQGFQKYYRQTADRQTDASEDITSSFHFSDF